jgi:hypothetical protein
MLLRAETINMSEYDFWNAHQVCPDCGLTLYDGEFDGDEFLF